MRLETTTYFVVDCSRRLLQLKDRAEWSRRRSYLGALHDQHPPFRSVFEAGLDPVDRVAVPFRVGREPLQHDERVLEVLAVWVDDRRRTTSPTRLKNTKSGCIDRQSPIEWQYATVTESTPLCDGFRYKPTADLPSRSRGRVRRAQRAQFSGQRPGVQLEVVPCNQHRPGQRVELSSQPANRTSGEVCLPERALTYADWTKRLCEHFFRRERSGLPVTLFVDNDVLGALEGSGDGDRAVASLTAAVRSRLTPDSYARRFHRIDDECTKWKVDGAHGCPPSLPLLAVAVLAGTHMAREAGIAPNNYWKRFDDLLGLGRGDRKGITEVLPGLWDQLTWWLDTRHNGELGRSTIQEDSWWTIIGYALSQALFRESDRQHLTEFFYRIGLAPAEEVSPSELLQYFKAWVPKSRLSPGAKQMAGDSRYDERLAALLVDEASRWDGVLRDEKGRRIGSLVLMLEPFPQPSYRVGAERPVGFPEEAAFTGERGFSIALTASVEGWFAEAWPLHVEWLTNGLRLESDEFVLAFRGAPVLVLGKNRDLGCWASVRRLEPSEEHYVLAHESQASAVESFLDEHALAWLDASSY